MEKDTVTTVLMHFLSFMVGIIAFPTVWLMITGDFPGAAMFYGLQEDSQVVDWLFTVREVFVR